MYGQDQQAQQPGQGQPGGGPKAETAAEGAAKDDGNVVDAEYTEVKDKKG